MLRFAVRLAEKWSVGKMTAGSQPEGNNRHQVTNGSTPLLRLQNLAHDERALVGADTIGLSKHLA